MIFLKDLFIIMTIAWTFSFFALMGGFYVSKKYNIVKHTFYSGKKVGVEFEYNKKTDTVKFTPIKR